MGRIVHCFLAYTALFRLYQLCRALTGLDETKVPYHVVVNIFNFAVHLQLIIKLWDWTAFTRAMDVYLNLCWLNESDTLFTLMRFEPQFSAWTVKEPHRPQLNVNLPQDNCSLTPTKIVVEPKRTAALIAQVWKGKSVASYLFVCYF